VISAYDADALVGAEIITPDEAIALVNELDNLLGACPSCNSAKQDALPGNIPGTWRPSNPSQRAIDIMKRLGTWREGQ
jgi:5-methylcytosine-specific restriction endonuclease McrA